MRDDDFDEKEAKLAALREAIDAGIAELEAGIGIGMTPAELIADVLAEVGLGFDK